MVNPAVLPKQNCLLAPLSKDFSWLPLPQEMGPLLIVSSHITLFLLLKLEVFKGLCFWIVCNNHTKSHRPLSEFLQDLSFAGFRIVTSCMTAFFLLSLPVDLGLNPRSLIKHPLDIYVQLAHFCCKQRLAEHSKSTIINIF